MSKKNAAAPKKKSAPAKPVSKKPAPKPVTKKPSAPAKKPAAKTAAKPIAKKVTAKKQPVKKVAPPAKKTAPKPAAKPVAKKAPAKKSTPKTAAKPVAKKTGKAPAKAPVAKKSSVKTPAKKPAKPAPKKPATPAKPAGKKTPPPIKKPSEKVSKVIEKIKNQSKPAAPVKVPAKAPKSKKHERAPRPVISFSFDEIREYLKTRQNAKINVYVPGDENEKTASSAKKALAKAEAQKPKNRNVGAVSVADILGFNPFKKDEAKFEEEKIPQKWRKYYRILLDLRSHLQDGLALHSEEALKKSGKEDSGDLSGYGQHMADAGTDSFDRDFALGLVSGEQEALFEIAEAIERMKKGNYGVCEITGKAIPADRLTAVPFTRYTLEGQRHLERNRLTRKRGGIGNPVADLGDGMNFGTPAEETEEA